MRLLLIIVLTLAAVLADATLCPLLTLFRTDFAWKFAIMLSTCSLVFPSILIVRGINRFCKERATLWDAIATTATTLLAVPLFASVFVWWVQYWTPVSIPDKDVGLIRIVALMFVTMSGVSTVMYAKRSAVEVKDPVTNASIEKNRRTKT